MEGSTDFETGLVDQWIEFATNEMAYLEVRNELCCAGEWCKEGRHVVKGVRRVSAFTVASLDFTHPRTIFSIRVFLDEDGAHVTDNGIVGKMIAQGLLIESLSCTHDRRNQAKQHQQCFVERLLQALLLYNGAVNEGVGSPRESYTRT